MLPLTVDAAILDWLTSVGTLGAVIVAIVAVIASQASVRSERQHQRLRERHRDAVELLAAYEAVCSLAPAWWTDELASPPPTDFHAARGRYLALLRASEEPLPINRGSLRHIPFGATDDEAAHLANARQEGDPEREDTLQMAVRGELIDSIEHLRSRLNGKGKERRG